MISAARPSQNMAASSTKTMAKMTNVGKHWQEVLRIAFKMWWRLFP